MLWVIPGIITRYCTFSPERSDHVGTTGGTLRTGHGKHDAVLSLEVGAVGTEGVGVDLAGAKDGHGWVGEWQLVGHGHGHHGED